MIREKNEENKMDSGSNINIGEYRIDINKEDERKTNKESGRAPQTKNKYDRTQWWEHDN